jgi:hypothetical protein
MKLKRLCYRVFVLSLDGNLSLNKGGKAGKRVQFEIILCRSELVFHLRFKLPNQMSAMS